MSHPVICSWNPTHGVLVDQMGIPLPLADVLWLANRAAEHATRSPEQLEAVALKLIRKNCPSMEHQLDLRIYADESPAESDPTIEQGDLAVPGG